MVHLSTVERSLSNRLTTFLPRVAFLLLPLNWVSQPTGSTSLPFIGAAVGLAVGFLVGLGVGFLVGLGVTFLR